MELSQLQNFDYIILAIIFLSTYIGWKNGLIKTFISFFAWIGSAIIVADNYELVFGFINSRLHSKFISGFIASVGLYIALVIGFSLLGEKVSKTTDKFGGSTTDKVTGTIFGASCGVLIACTIFWVSYMALYTLNDQKLPKWFVEAKGYKLLKIGSDSLVSLIASEEERQKLLNLIKHKTNKLEDEVKKNIGNKSKEPNVSKDEVIEEE